MKKRVIASILIFITIFNIIQPTLLAESETIDSEISETEDSSTEKYNNFINNGTATVKSEDSDSPRVENLRTTQTSGAVGANILVNIVNGVFIAIELVISKSVAENMFDGYTFTIYDAVFNKIDLFNANYLLASTNESEIHNKISDNIKVWYNSLRNLAIILSLAMLIYIGIRMALSTLANDKAKYKKMLLGWLQSFILIFFMHYLILISMVLSEKMMEIIGQLNTDGSTNEYAIFIKAMIAAATKPGWDAVPPAILFWILSFYHIKFFLLYAKRMLSVAFLIIISPLITVTYSIDKAGDGRAQAFTAWVKEFEVNMFIQPLHALLYIIFIVSAAAIATKVPLLYAIFFMALSRGEKVVKSLFNARGMKSISSMGKGKGKRIL